MRQRSKVFMTLVVDPAIFAATLVQKLFLAVIWTFPSAGTHAVAIKSGHLMFPICYFFFIFVFTFVVAEFECDSASTFIHVFVSDFTRLQVTMLPGTCPCFIIIIV